MKKILVSQRVDIVVNYKERRDSLDQKWYSFLLETGAIAFPVPNDKNIIHKLITEISPDGILLTGGNNPYEHYGNAPERDETDNLLIKYSLLHDIPLIGVCRGMQSIIIYFDGILKSTSNHIAKKHSVSGKINRTVNSYHTLTSKFIPSCFDVLACSHDGLIEAIKHSSLPIYAIMWHPEREEEFNKNDIELFYSIWKGESKII